MVERKIKIKSLAFAKLFWFYNLFVTVDVLFHPNGSGQYLFGQVVHFKKPHIINKYIFANGTNVNNDIQPVLFKSCSLFIYATNET